MISGSLNPRPRRQSKLTQPAKKPKARSRSRSHLP
ncbi:Protein of unknown function [Pyronema omphalodes CBS 100304]|uniref:Uncharacterized protein n=1 Tax=Pyronema omphalodes (strain CBS 100304) TaxID=1076935 RepID=U4LC73_PYROM|nr:Protein of unknown function [Pyronema omphalodes CBS 100304]